jgi:hypothetical protein
MTEHKIINKTMKRIFGILILMILIGSCYYDKEELLYPVDLNSCDTSNVSYSSGVSPLLSQYCLMCHGANYTTSGGGVNLNDYANVKTYVDNGKLMGSIKHETGFSPMPKGGGMMNDCIIAIFESWITKGSLNN